METSDKQFYLAFSGILVALVFLTVFVAIVANIAGSQIPTEKSNAQAEKIHSRIQPVGRVNLASAPNPDLTVAAAALVGEPMDQVSVTVSENLGERVYQMVCQSCHASGLVGAPKVGDVAAWSVRLEAGIDALYNSGLNGKGAVMPPRGGNPSLSDTEVKAAVDYMVSTSR